MNLHHSNVESGFCPCCLNTCYWIKVRSGGRRFGLKWAGDRALSIFGEVIFDRAGVTYWHMAIEEECPDMSDASVLSHFFDDLKYMERAA